MNIERDVALDKYSTMRLGGVANALVKINNKDELQQAWQWAKEHQLAVIMIGGGSNIIWREEGFGGLIIVNQILGKEILHQDDSSATVKIGAGEDWDSTVDWTVRNSWSGIECLSLIPGSTGATPVQNVGAYGQEISQTLVELEAYDTQTEEFVTIKGEDCAFGYRTSRFKTNDKGRYWISSITLKLSKSRPQPPFYEAIEKFFADNYNEAVTVESLREAVITIRSAKLPDPAHVANNGSFFANPIIMRDHFEGLKSRYHKIKFWELPNGQYKIAAAWLLEQAGFKNYHDKETGMSTWPNQPLVFTNERAKSTADLINFRDKIIAKVEEMFGITLEQEPEILP